MDLSYDEKSVGDSDKARVKLYHIFQYGSCPLVRDTLFPSFEVEVSSKQTLLLTERSHHHHKRLAHCVTVSKKTCLNVGV